MDLQARWSALPTRGTLLAETLHSREGWHLFLYPFAGRSVHLGLGSLLAWRLGQQVPATFSVAVNDYGLELLASAPLDWATGCRACWPRNAKRDLAADVLGSLNAGELSLRRFREIARVAGLIFQELPRRPQERASCRRHRACSARSSASTTRPTCCSGRPNGRC